MIKTNSFILNLTFSFTDMANFLRIKTIAEEKNISMKEISEAIGMTPTGLSKIIRENSTKTTTLEKIALKLKVPISNFFDDGNYNVRKSDFDQVSDADPPIYSKRKKIPFYDGMRVAGELSGTKEPTGYIDAGDWFYDATAAMRVYGKSMAPDYNAGSIAALRLVCNTSLIVYGQDYVIESDEFRIIKRIQKSDLPDHILCCSVNQERYENSQKLRNESFDVPISEIRRLFRVVGCINRNESSGILLTSHE